MAVAGEEDLDAEPIHTPDDSSTDLVLEVAESFVEKKNKI